MKKVLLFPCALLAVALAACVTINVYFPAADAEKAADRIIGDVIGKTADAAPENKGSSTDTPSPTGANAGAAQTPDALTRGARLLAAGLNQALSLVVSPALAAAPDFDISSPAIRQITDAMKTRHGQLAKYYDSGAIGYTADGLVAVRDANLIALAERNTVRNAVADENRDRTALYTEIAKANGHPEWVADIRSTFAKRWVANAKSGWYYNDGSGWKQK